MFNPCYCLNQLKFVVGWARLINFARELDVGLRAHAYAIIT
jgi:hypothetical protein